MKSFSFKYFAVTVVVAMSGYSFASDEPATAATTEVTKTSYKTTESIAIDRLVQKIYANSPLNTAILRKALVEANPKVITGNPQQRVKSGTVIVVPDHAEIVRVTLSPLEAVAPKAQDNNPGARDYPARKQWVRYP
jgi:Tfp pilus assembly protein FimV